jgi:hypothetical protein
MKILYPPASGRRGNDVFYPSRFGMASHTYCVPRNVRSAPQQRMRAAFGSFAQMWGGKLTPAQRDHWNAEGANVWSHPRCGTQGKLSGENFFTGINSTLACCHLPPVWEPPARILFQLSPVRGLVVTNDEDGVRLFLRLAAAPAEDIMVFGQAPCSAGRSKRRNVSYLGLLPPAEGGLSEITDLYKAKYGEPRAGTKVFIVTCQQKNGWKGLEQETNEIVPGGPEGQQAASESATLGASAPATLENSSKRFMHKGCTRGAQGAESPQHSPSPGGAETRPAGGVVAMAASDRGGGGGAEGGPGAEPASQTS